MSKSEWTPLKGLMWQRGAKMKDLQKVTGHGQTYVCVRLCGHKPWTMQDIQGISALLDTPLSMRSFTYLSIFATRIFSLCTIF